MQRYNYFQIGQSQPQSDKTPFSQLTLLFIERPEESMNYPVFSMRIKRGLQATLVLAILLINFGPGNTQIAYAAPPSNDNFASATVVGSIPYTSSIVTTEAASAGDGPIVNQPCDGKLLAKGFKNVWYRYTPATTAPVNVDALGTNYDTYIAIWTGPDISSLTLVACDDDNDAGFQSQMVFDANAGTTYYIEVAEFSCTQSPTCVPEPSVGGNLIVHVREPAYVDVRIAATLEGQYIFAHKSSLRQSYAGVDNGPVRVQSTNGVPIVASERVSYFNGSAWTSHSELMGLPVNQLTTSYTFPWYNNLDLNSQLRFGNVGTATTTVTVTIAGVFKGNYTLLPNESRRVSYPALDKGPVKVTSSGGVPIIASLRVAYFDGSAWTSFSEMMGMPSPKLTNSYVFPWYNNLDLNSQLRFGNVGGATTTVTVTIGGVFKGNYTLLPNTATRISYPALDSGPVKVTSSGNVPIIASMRVAYFDGSAWSDFSEMMGLPLSSLSSHYSFPVYNNVDLNSQMRFGNVGSAPTTVTVTINGVLKGTYNLNPNQSRRVSYNGMNSGPVVVQSTGGVPIVASERVAYFNGTAWSSFAEMMGLPQAQLSTTFVFPWYNNLDLDTQIRFGVP
jgi:hypothetical protein